jgi:hypothetical protein
MKMFCEDYIKSTMIESVARIFPSAEQEVNEKETKTEFNRDVGEDFNVEDGEDDMDQLSDVDFKVLLDNFDSLSPHEQQRLFAHIRESGSEKFENLGKILTEEGVGHLFDALMD